MADELGGGSWKHKWGVNKVKELYDAQSGNFRRNIIEAILAQYSEEEHNADTWPDVVKMWQRDIPSGARPDAYLIDDEKKHIDIYEVVVTSDLSDKKCLRYHNTAMAVDEDHFYLDEFTCSL